MDDENSSDMGAVMGPNGWVVTGKGRTTSVQMDDLIKRLEGWGAGAALQNHFIGSRSARKDCAEAAAALSEARAEIARLREALTATTQWMEQTRASGDAGFWDWGPDDVYTRARAALEAKHG